MYIWKIDKLKADIKAGQLTENDRFYYSFLYLVFTAISLELMRMHPHEQLELRDYIVSCVNILIVAVGTICAFKANGGRKGTDFLGKYFSIGFVVAVRFTTYFILILALFIAYCLYHLKRTGEGVNSPDTIGAILFLVWSVVLYWRLCTHIKQVNV